MKLYLRYFSIHFKSVMQYKASFLLTLTGQFIAAFSAFFSMYFLFQRFHIVDGFTYQQVLLCFAIVTTSFSLAECFIRGFDRFASIIGNGEFDRMMVRPCNIIFQVLASKIEFTRLGKLLQALLVFGYALPTSGVHWTADKVLTLVLMIAGGMAVFSGLFIIHASLCFFTLEGLEFINIFTDGGRQFAAYPVSIYGNGVLRFLTFVVPIACFQYYPFIYLIGLNADKRLIAVPFFTLLFLIPCLLLWQFGVRHFKSTGS